MTDTHIPARLSASPHTRWMDLHIEYEGRSIASVTVLVESTKTGWELHWPEDYVRWAPWLKEAAEKEMFCRFRREKTLDT